jgi:hypothetical protein|tara:strand:- start:18475 stop:19365 length:891 start_codon:yes stop_codon:yes gene_type:complete
MPSTLGQPAPGTQTGYQTQNYRYNAPGYNAGPSTTQNNIARSAERVGVSKVDPVGKGLGFYGKKKKQPRDFIWRNGDNTGGFNSLLDSYEGGMSGSQGIQNILSNFQGNREELADFMEVAGPLMGGLEANRLEGSEAFQYMQDSRNWDQGAYAGYGQAAGAIGQQTANSQRSAGEAMSQRGLGLSSGNVALQSMLGQQGGNQQAILRGETEQRAAQNRMQSATQMQDAYRLLAQMTMGQGLLPRITSPQGGGGGAGAAGGIAGGAMAGAQLGSAVGPWGTLIGGVVGAGAGYAATR